MARNKTAACILGKLGDDGNDFSDDELDEIIERLEGRTKARKAAGIYGDETRLRFADAERAAYELRLAAAVTKRNAALQVAVMNQARMHIASFSSGKSTAGTKTKDDPLQPLSFEQIKARSASKPVKRGMVRLYSLDVKPDDANDTVFYNETALGRKGSSLMRGVWFVDVPLDRAQKWGHANGTYAVPGGIASRARDVASLRNPRAPGGMSDVQGLKALLAGSNKQVDGARESVDALYRARVNEFAESLFAELEREKLTQYLQGRKILGVGLGPGILDEKIMSELWELTSPSGKPGISESPEALRVAQTIHKYMDLARITQNRHGAFIEELRGYIAYQMHSPDKLREAGFQKWRDDVFKYRIDMARTFGQEFANTADINQIDEALQGIYETLTTGKMSDDMPTGPEIDPKADKTKNVAKEVSHRRVLHFTDAQGWGGYDTEYGHGSMMNAVLWTLDRSAKTTAMLERLGPNPRATFASLRDELIQMNKADPKTVDALRSAEIDRLMDAADGATDQVDSPFFATAGAAVRSVETMSSLGGMVLSSITDFPVQAMRLTYNGKNFFEGLGEQVSGFVGNNREHADHLAFGVNALIGDVASRFHGNENLSGWLGKMTQVFFKANLGHWWDTRRHRAFIASLGSELYGARAKAWGDLDERLRGTLATYGFDAPEWDVVRHYGAMPKGDGGVIAGEGMRHVPDEIIRPLLGKRQATAGALDRMRDKLERMVRSYYADQLAWATLQPGTREKALTTMGQKRGTALGELARSFFLFKGYPIQYWQKVFGAMTQEDQHLEIAKGLFALPKADNVRLAQLLATTTALGYVAFALKDIAKGRTPRDPRDAKVWGAAFLQGGGLGLYGDFMLGQTNRYGQSFLASVGGPVAGDIEATQKIWNTIFHVPTAKDPEAEIKNVGDLLFKFGKENTPFANIFYARAALDYLVFYRIQEWMNPGSLRRMERRVKEETGNEFILPPSEVIN